MGALEAEFNLLRSSSQASRFIRTNLHLHTPATPWDWDSYPGQSTKSSALDAATYFDALNKTSLDMVAITDHNCVLWCSALVQAARQARDSGRSRLVVLPGVEITTYEGPHIVGIFDESLHPELIHKMLLRLGLFADGRENDRVGLAGTSVPTLRDVLREITEELNGVAVAPHVDNKDGLWGPKEFRGRSDILNDPHLRVLAAPSGSIKRVEESDGRVRLLYKNMDSSQILNSFAFIDIADCHRLEDLELHSPWIKMGRPSLGGFRQIIFEPELRIAHAQGASGMIVENPVAIAFTPPPVTAHPAIVGVAVSGGMLDGFMVSLSPHQNCIIGKNYSGKSAVLDSIRFALDALPSDPDARGQIVNRLRGILGDGGQVRLYLEARDGQAYCATRTLSSTSIRGGRNPLWDCEGDTEPYVLVGEEFMPQSEMAIREIFPVEVYPQGELVRIKDNIPRQMNIVDALVARDDLTIQLLPRGDEPPSLFDRLQANSEEICSLLGKRDELLEDVGRIPQFEAELAKLEDLISTDRFVGLQQWRDLEAEAARTSRELRQLLPYWEALEVGATLTPPRRNGPPVESASNGVIPASMSSQAASVLARVRMRLTRIHALALASINQGATALDEIALEAGRNATGLVAQLSEEAPAGETDISAAIIGRIAQKKGALAELNSKRDEAASIEARVSGLQEQRAQLLNQLDAVAMELHTARKTVVEQMNTGLSEDVIATLLESSDTSVYREVLETIATGLVTSSTRIVNRQEQLDAVVSRIPPRSLAEFIRKRDAQAIVEAAPTVTPNTAHIIAGAPLEDVHRLEACLLGDLFSISFRKEGDATYTPIDGGLSGGEQALALISVAMVPKHLPLLVDQPEDELGPALITRNLVEQIRRVKPSRQLVFVTHVPNIPVLGDSEQIIHMEQRHGEVGKSLVATSCGPLDDPDVVARVIELDGGPAAFSKRRERYSASLSQ